MERRRKLVAIGVGLLPIALVVGLFAWRYDVVYVSGGSMSPALASGDLVVVDSTAEVAADDIVLMQQPGHSRVLHRVAKRVPDGWITKGDANPVVDRLPAADSWMQGTVVAVLPLGAALERWRPASACATLSAQPKSTRR